MASKLAVLITFFLAAALAISLQVNARDLPEPSISLDASKAGEGSQEGAIREADPTVDPPRQLRYGFFQGGSRESYPWINAHQNHGELPGFQPEWVSQKGGFFDQDVKEERSWLRNQHYRPAEQTPWKYLDHSEGKRNTFSGFTANPELAGIPEFPQRGDAKYFHFAQPQTKPQN